MLKVKKMIIFKEINNENISEVLSLKVNNSQKDYIESIEKSLDDAKNNAYGIKWTPVGIYYNNLMIGFTMYGLNSENYLWIDRFLIDYRYQNKGYGRKTLNLLIKYLKDHYSVSKCICLSVSEKNEISIKLYKELGFSFTCILDGNDPVMALVIN